MIVFQWMNKDKGTCSIKGASSNLYITVQDWSIKNPEPDSIYLAYYGERSEYTHLLLLPKRIQERVALLQIAPFNEHIEGVGVKLGLEICYVYEEE